MRKNLEQIKSLYTVASQAIHAFSVTSWEAKRIGECEALTKDRLADDINTSVKRDKEYLNKNKENFEKLKTILLKSREPTKQPTPVIPQPQDQFVSVFSPKSDSRTVWQYLKDILSGKD